MANQQEIVLIKASSYRLGMLMIKEFWLFHCGFIRVPRGFIIKGGGLDMSRLPFLCGLVIHEKHGPILIDAPFGHEGPVNAGDTLGAMLKTAGLTFEPDWAVVPRIEQLGFRTSEIHHILMTHLHWDHTGGMKSLGHAKFHVDQSEWDLACGMTNMEAARAGFAQGDFRALKSRIDFLDMSEAKFDSGFDVFGDGSLEAVPLPGHSVGHVGYRFKVGEQEIFFLGDAAFSIGQVTRGEKLGVFPRLVAENKGAVESTLNALRHYHAENPDVALLTSHDFDLAEITANGPHKFA